MRAPSVCIVGCGPAGAILAAKLADAGLSVTVLEAGPRFDRQNDPGRVERALRYSRSIEAVWDMGGERDSYANVGPDRYQLNEYRVKGVGGSTLHWGAMTPRLHPEDFAMQSRYGVGDDWPLSYSDLEPYYVAAERELGVAGAPAPYGGPRSAGYPMSAHPASHADSLLEPGFIEQGLRLHPAPRAINAEPYADRAACDGTGTCMPVCPTGAKYDARTHASRAESAGATIRPNTPVLELATEEDGRQISHAVVAAETGTEQVSADTFVVAAGAVETARLLRLSASDRHPAGLGNESGALGRRLMEHPGVRVEGQLPVDTRQQLIGFSTSISEGYYGHEDGPEGSMILEPQNYAGTAPATAATTFRSTLGAIRAGEQPGGAWGEDLVGQVRSQLEGAVSIAAWVEQPPLPENCVRLDRSTTDSDGRPVPAIDYRLDPATTGILERAVTVLHEILNAVGAAEIRTVHGPETPFYPAHRLGTTRMGTDPTKSVVTPTLRVHGLSNLYVSSGSVFPTGGAANPTLSIAALTIRLADHLIETLGGPSVEPAAQSRLRPSD